MNLRYHRQPGRFQRFIPGQHNASGNGVVRSTFTISRQLQKRITGYLASRLHTKYRKPSLCDGAGLIEYNCINIGQCLKKVAALNKNTGSRCSAYSTEE